MRIETFRNKALELQLAIADTRFGTGLQLAYGSAKAKKLALELKQIDDIDLMYKKVIEIELIEENVLKSYAEQTKDINPTMLAEIERGTCTAHTLLIHFIERMTKEGVVK